MSSLTQLCFQQPLLSTARACSTHPPFGSVGNPISAAMQALAKAARQLGRRTFHSSSATRSADYEHRLNMVRRCT